MEQGSNDSVPSSIDSQSNQFKIPIQGLMHHLPSRMEDSMGSSHMNMLLGSLHNESSCPSFVHTVGIKFSFAWRNPINPHDLGMVISITEEEEGTIPLIMGEWLFVAITTECVEDVFSVVISY